MGLDDFDRHWRQPAEEDVAAWIRELRSRSHDFGDWASRMEGRQVEMKQKIDGLGTADEIADKVQERLQHKLGSVVGVMPKFVMFIIGVMTCITMIRTF